MYLVQVQEITDNQAGTRPILSEYPVWRTRYQTPMREDAQWARDLLRQYYTRVRVMRTREAVELADDMQDLL